MKEDQDIHNDSPGIDPGSHISHCAEALSNYTLTTWELSLSLSSV